MPSVPGAPEPAVVFVRELQVLRVNRPAPDTSSGAEKMTPASTKGVSVARRL